MRKNGRSVPISYSQNFLTSGKIIRKIVSLASFTSRDAILEIGPGKGHITAALLEKCGFVTAVEKDTALFQKLKTKLSDDKLKLLNLDFLDFRLPASGQYYVFSSIPFALTTQIIRMLTESINPPEACWLIVEKGAAKRFCGLPRESLRSLCLKPFFNADIVFHFRREDFHPTPGVDVVLLRICKKAVPDIPLRQRSFYEGFIADLLAGKPEVYFTKNRFRSSMGAIGAGFITSEMKYVQWLCLFRSLTHFKRR